jgi:membrane-associated phospholipid phosphatase
LLIWLVSGRKERGGKAFWQYCVMSIMMYVMGILFYIFLPTVTVHHDFFAGPIQKLAADSMFYSTFAALDLSPFNVFGSFPSYHNFWAALFVLFGISGVKNGSRIFGGIVILYGLVVSLSTLMLHQHALLDVIFTYAIVCLFYLITVKYALDDKLWAVFVPRTR